jgi:hypothetical protein
MAKAIISWMRFVFMDLVVVDGVVFARNVGD